MPSPFHPAMDPQIEASGLWETFHGSFVQACGDMLNERLPPNYVAISEVRTRLTSVHEEAEWDAPAHPAPTGQHRPDVVVARTAPSPARAGDVAGVATLEPAAVVAADEWVEVKERYIDILHLPDRQVVTSIELLSPANKQGAGRADYQQKRAQTQRAGVNLLEIDLLLAGQRLEPEEKMPPGDYFAVLSRAELYPNLLIYAWRRADALPTLPVPLRAPDADVGLELAALVASVYDRGRYGSLITYRA